MTALGNYPLVPAQRARHLTRVPRSGPLVLVLYLKRTGLAFTSVPDWTPAACPETLAQKPCSWARRKCLILLCGLAADCLDQNRMILDAQPAGPLRVASGIIDS
jgi:hypothetical protein